MKIIFLLGLIIALAATVVVLSPHDLFAQNNATGNAGNTGGNSGNTGGNSGNTGIDVTAYLDNLYIWFLGFVGISALFAIVVGGVLYMFSGTSITKVDQAKKWISNAILGIVIAAFSYLLLYTINPDLIRGFNIDNVVSNAISGTVINPTPPPPATTPPPDNLPPT